MTTPQPIPPQPHKSALTAGAADRLYQRMMAEYEQNPDPESEFWHNRFAMAARHLANTLGVDKYRRWFDLHFPEGRHFTWRQQFLATNAALWHIETAQDDEREQRIECEMQPSPESLPAVPNSEG